MRKLEIAKHELLKLQLKRLELYKKRPDLWYKERWKGNINDLYWDRWDSEAYAKHKWDGTKNPFYEIFKALVDYKWVGVESATSTGKTYIIPRIAYWFLDCYKNSQVIITAPKLDQLRRIVFKEVNNSFKGFKRIQREAELFDVRVQVKKSLEEKEYSLVGTTAGVKAGQESAVKMAGVHNENLLFIIDEATDVSPAIYRAIENTSTAKNNLICAFGNPDSQNDPLHKFCLKHKTTHIRISGYDHPNVVLESAGKKIVIPGAVSVTSINDRLMDYGEKSNLFLSRVRGLSPAQSIESLIRVEWLEEAFTNNNHPSYGYNACGIDAANSTNGDAGAVAIGERNALCFLKEFNCPSASHLTYNLLYSREELEINGFNDYDLPLLTDYDCYEPRNIGIDGIGVGSSTVNAFKDLHYDVVSLMGSSKPLDEVIPKDSMTGQPLYRFKNLRSQMYWQLRIDLEKKRIKLNIPKHIFKALANELTAIKYTSIGAITIESKEQIYRRIGKSPNLADAVVYWNWMKNGYYL